MAIATYTVPLLNVELGVSFFLLLKKNKIIAFVLAWSVCTIRMRQNIIFTVTLHPYPCKQMKHVTKGSQLRTHCLITVPVTHLEFRLLKTKVHKNTSCILSHTVLPIHLTFREATSLLLLKRCKVSVSNPRALSTEIVELVSCPQLLVISCH